VGVAAYQRGNMVITRGIAMDLGEPDPFRPYIPTPRPSAWGDKARTRAEDHARRIVRGLVRLGYEVDPEVLVYSVADRARVGMETARAAVATVLS
jgi:hypothetical protein